MLCNWLDWKVPEFIWIPMLTISNGMLSLALVSLGAQIAAVKLFRNTSTVLLSSFMRLLIAPLLAFFFIGFFQLQGITAQALWIASAMPTSRNSAALALEYNNEPEFAAQAVLVSTLLSSVTLTGVVYLSQVLFS
jgi:predicted permease